jgi:hypothetical protein
VLLDLLAVNYRSRPGHFFGSIGLAFGLLGSLVMAYLAVVKFGLGEDIGQRPLFFIGILLVITSVQCLTTGVLAEMLGRGLGATTETTVSLLHPGEAARRADACRTRPLLA